VASLLANGEAQVTIRPTGTGMLLANVGQDMR